MTMPRLLHPADPSRGYPALYGPGVGEVQCGQCGDVFKAGGVCRNGHKPGQYVEQKHFNIRGERGERSDD
jgi:hypothetical protein